MGDTAPKGRLRHYEISGRYSEAFTAENIPLTEYMIIPSMKICSGRWNIRMNLVNGRIHFLKMSRFL